MRDFSKALAWIQLWYFVNEYNPHKCFWIPSKGEVSLNVCDEIQFGKISIVRNERFQTACNYTSICIRKTNKKGDRFEEREGPIDFWDWNNGSFLQKWGENVRFSMQLI